MEASVGKTIWELFRSRSSAATIATCSRKGEIDIAPVGSAFLHDASTVGLLRGPLSRTYQNLRENPEAVVMVANHNVSRWLRFFLTGKFGASFGYRIHVRLREVKPLPDDQKNEILRGRFGIVAETKGGRKIAGTLRELLLFDILEIREITPFR